VISDSSELPLNDRTDLGRQFRLPLFQISIEFVMLVQETIPDRWKEQRKESIDKFTT